MNLLEHEEIALEWFWNKSSNNSTKETYCTLDEARNIFNEVKAIAEKVFEKSKYKDIKDSIEYSAINQDNLSLLTQSGVTTICVIKRTSFDSHYKLSDKEVTDTYRLFTSATSEIKSKVKNSKINIISEVKNDHKEWASIMIKLSK